jgi:hypothetical protein
MAWMCLRRIEVIAATLFENIEEVDFEKLELSSSIISCHPGDDLHRLALLFCPRLPS